jgi:DNA mismatch repair protein MutS
VRPGPANQSYGLHVAELAGVPRAVVAEARRHLETLERQQRALTPPSPQQALRFDAAEAELERLKARIAALDADSLSPREALDLLYELVAEARRL